MAFFKGATIKNGATVLCRFVSVVSGSRCFCGGVSVEELAERLRFRTMEPGLRVVQNAPLPGYRAGRPRVCI